MLSTRKLAPGLKGTRKLHEKYGNRLMCVRYRYDDEARKRYKTVELIVEESDWTPLQPLNRIIELRVALAEVEIQRRIKQAGGRWNAERKLWELPYRQAVKLKLKDRIVKS